jgi:hypothetical protein
MSLYPTVNRRLEKECKNPYREWLSYISSWKDHSFRGWCDFETPTGDFSQQIMIVMFFRHGRLLVLYVLPKGQKDNQDYWLDDILARVKAGKTRMALGKGANPPDTHWSFHLSRGSQSDDKNQGCRAATSVSSTWLTALSPCDFWDVEMLRQKMMDRHLQSAEEIRGMIQAGGVEWLWMTTKVVLPNG